MVIVIVFLPWQIYTYNIFPFEYLWESSFNIKHITQVLEKQTGPFYYYINIIRINYGELIYLPLLFLLYDIYKKPKEIKLIILFLWIFIPILFFSVAKTKMQGYILFVSPALFIITSDFYFKINEYRKKYSFKLFFNLILLLLILLPIRYSIERIKPFQKLDRNPKWVKDLKVLGKIKLKNGVLFNYSKPIDAMFYTDFVVYNYMPDKKKLQDLMRSGYYIVINDNGHLPYDIKSLKGINFIRLDCNF